VRAWTIFCVVAHWAIRIIYRLAEGGTVIAILAVGYWVGYWIIFGNVLDPHYDRMVKVLQTVDANWKAFLLLGIPLFYRTIRTFLERVEKAWGIEATKPKNSGTTGPNPTANS
jgi:hypothetical protein